MQIIGDFRPLYGGLCTLYGDFVPFYGDSTIFISDSHFLKGQREELLPRPIRLTPMMRFLPVMHPFMMMVMVVMWMVVTAVAIITFTHTWPHATRATTLSLWRRLKCSAKFIYAIHRVLM